MPDFTLCKDNECPKRHNCFRYMIMPSKTMQSYFMSSPRKGNECKYFSHIEKGMILNLENLKK